MRNYIWQYERGWGVFCSETDKLLAWSERHCDAVKQSELINQWNGPSFLGSNVVNVQSSAEQLSALIKEAWRLVDKGGSVLLNYPKSPRKYPGMSFEDLGRFIYERLERKVAIVETHVSELVYRLYK